MNRTTSLAYLGVALVLCAGCLPPEYAPLEDPSAVPEPAQAPDGTGGAVREWEPEREAVDVPGRASVIAHWQLPPTSPWLAYQKFTLPAVLSAAPTTLTLPDVVDLDEVLEAHEAGSRIAQVGIPSGVAFFVDLPGPASVSFAKALSTLSPAPIAAIPTFNNWPAEGELIPAEQTLAAMIAMPPRLPDDDAESAVPVFLLDSWRLAYKEEVIDDEVVDNRYMLTNADFPSAEVLRGRGISEIVYLVASNDILDEEDDLNELFTAYEEQGITIYMVDASSLARLRSESQVAWYVEARSHCFLVRRRKTIVHDPRFYQRAHGGFGGAQLVATPSGHYGHGGGGHGGGGHGGHGGGGHGGGGHGGG